jgi:hypothetical protein
VDRVEEIEAVIAGLPPEEYRRLVDWIRDREETRWDEQMDQKFNFRQARLPVPGGEGRIRARAGPRVAAAEVNSVDKYISGYDQPLLFNISLNHKVAGSNVPLVTIISPRNGVRVGRSTF